MRYLGLFRLSVKEVTDNAGGGSVMDGTSACLHVHSAGKAGKVSTTTTVWCTENGTIKTSNGIYIYMSNKFLHDFKQKLSAETARTWPNNSKEPPRDWWAQAQKNRPTRAIQEKVETNGKSRGG